MNSILEIMFSLCISARYHSNPKESHYNATKRILKHVKGTTCWIVVPGGVSLSLIEFSNLDL